MKTIDIDIETYCDLSLRDVGLYRYAEHDSFEILLLTYSIDGQDEVCIDLTEEELPQDLIDLIMDKDVLKIAHNAQFERVCLSEHLGLVEIEGYLDPRQWYCTMVHALELGLPASLAKLAQFLNLDEQKDSSGMGLIRFFSMPCKPTKANGGRTRNLPEHDPERWEQYKQYNIQDVRTEKAIYHKLLKVPVEESEWEIWYLDQLINDTGVKLDRTFVENAISIMNTNLEKNAQRLKDITQLENPNSVAQMKDWLSDKGYPLDSLSKANVKDLLTQPDLDKDAKQALELRLLTSNASTKKYLKMDEVMSARDDRARGTMQFSGASTTQRWAGRLIQVQNLPRNKMEHLNDARDMVKTHEAEDLSFIFGDVSDVLKQLLRTALVTDEGKEFLISDYSAIEARVLAWYAKEEWVLSVFRSHGKIYEATAAQMYNIPIEQVDSDMRQKGKVATLALGYQGSVGALKAMGALKMGIAEHELKGIVDSWRESNPNIVKFWKSVEDKAIDALSTKQRQFYNGLTFYRKKGFLFIELASGRTLAYPNAKLEFDGFGEKIVYTGDNGKRIDTYGGKLTENIVQATARDILANGLMHVHNAGYQIAFHVHDEVVVEDEKGKTDIETINQLLAKNPDWCLDLPLDAEGFKTDYYMKD